MSKFCTECGSQIPDESRFCPSCGKDLGMQDRKGPGPERKKPAPTKNWNVNPGTAAAAVHSPLFLVSWVFFVVNIVARLINIFKAPDLSWLYKIMESLPSSYSYDVYDLYSEFYLGLYENEMFDAFSTAIKSYQVIGLLFPVLLCVGMWLIYSTAIKPRVEATGFTMVRVVMIIRIIGYSLWYGCILLILIYFMIAVNLRDEYLVIFLTIALFICAIYAFYLIYYVKAIGAVDRVKKDLMSGVKSHLSSFVGVILIIYAVCTLISAYFANGFFGVIGALALCLARGALGIWMLQYDKN